MTTTATGLGLEDDVAGGLEFRGVDKDIRCREIVADPIPRDLTFEPDL